MKISVWWMAVLLAMGCGAGSAERKSGAPSPLDGVPPPAAQALRAQAGSAAIEGVERDTENGVEVYEASWHVGGLVREAAVTAGGELVELEVEVASADVPAPVRDAATRELAGATTLRFLKLLHDRYEVEGEVGGKKQEILLSSAGALLHGDENDDADDRGDTDD